MAADTWVNAAVETEQCRYEKQATTRNKTTVGLPRRRFSTILQVGCDVVARRVSDDLTELRWKRHGGQTNLGGWTALGYSAF
jgi:hypothetical protein